MCLCLMSVVGSVWLSLYELSLSLPKLSFKGSSVSGVKDVLELIEFQLVSVGSVG